MKAYFTHAFYDIKGRRLTICGIANHDRMSFGVAACSKKDRFVKRIGRNIAYGRAMKKPIWSFIIPSDENFGKYFIKTAKTIYTRYVQ